MGQSSSTVSKSPEFTRGYDEGREESTKALQGAFSAVAAQTYDTVHQHLEQLQAQQLDQTKQLSGELKNKLAPYTRVLVEKDAPCSLESSAAAACLKGNVTDPLACSSLIEKYSLCAAAISAGKR